MTILSTNSIGAGVRHDVATFTATQVLPGVVIASTDSTAMTMNGFSGRVSIAGAVYGLNAISVTSAANVDVLTILVQQGGILDGSSVGVRLLGDRHSISNNGTISGLDYAIRMEDFDSLGTANNYIANTGAIIGGSAGIFARDQVGMTVVNSGVISASEFQSQSLGLGLSVGSVFGAIVVVGTDTQIVNSGTIQSASVNGAAIKLAGGGASVVNSGVISGAGVGADLAAITLYSLTTEQMRVINGDTGIIQALGFSIQGRAGDELIVNGGEIIGDVQTREGADIIRNDGTIRGVVDLGDDADTFRSGESGIVTGAVRGGSGDDRFLGGNNGDAFFGNAGNDVINGGGGDDDLNGQSGEDLIRGGAGDDVVNGGLQKDILFGGSGGDAFVFAAVADSDVGAQRDQIRDFVQGEDLIDLSALAGPLFSYIGTGAFTGAGPQIRATATATGHSLVAVDANGDGVMDMQMLVFNTTALTEADFVL